MTTNTRPWADTRMAKFLDKRIGQLPKTQRELAQDMGYTRPNILSMMKSGEAKVPLDRVPAMAKALDADVAHFFRMALEQHFRGTEVTKVINDIFGTVVSKNEADWLEVVRDASDNTDPALTAQGKEEFASFLTQLFAKESGKPASVS